MEDLLAIVRKCRECEAHLALGPRPVLSASPKSRIAIIGQAPGTKVHKTGIPWDDPSGKQLRKWMGINEEEFYDPDKFAIVPMGFCYPGKGKSGDLPPRKECAPLWHTPVFSNMKEIECKLLIGQYAQRYYLGEKFKKNLTETVRSYQEYLPHFIVLPHPSPRNRFWLTKNPWFEEELIPQLKIRIKETFPK